jgi:hypothetical protein
MTAEVDRGAARPVGRPRVCLIAPGRRAMIAPMHAPAPALPVPPRLSVIVPTVKGPESWLGSVRALDRQARGARTEIVVATARESAPELVAENVRAVHVPGSNVFGLRACALAAARGEFVAVLEDHIAVGDEWCTEVIAGFDRNPRADAIIGGVTNGALRCFDRASFLLTFAPFLAPLDHVPLHRCPVPGIIAFRAAVLPRTPPAPGYLEFELPARLRDEGRLVAVASLRVEHVQHVGSRGFALQFHAGASYAGLNNLSVSARPRRERLRDVMVLPRRLVDQSREGLARVGADETLPCRAAVVAMAAANGLGQLVGIARQSVGRSPAHLE